MDNIGAGVIGLGVGRAHIDAYNHIEGVEVKGICDVSEKALKIVGEQFDIPFITRNYKKLLARDDIQVVSICTPDHLHAEHCLSALNRGKHILCEKPMCITLEDAIKLVEKVRETGLKFQVGNVNRYVPQFRFVKKLCQEGKLGDLFCVEGDYIHDMRSVYKNTPWRIDPQNPQDILLGGAVHPLDLARWVVGEVEEVFAYANKKSIPEFPLTDNYLCLYKFESGCLGKIWVTAGIRRVPEHIVNLNVYGSEGTVMSNIEEMECKVYINEGIEGQSGFTIVPLVETRGHPFRKEIAHFIDCIEKDETPLVNVEEGAKTIAALTAGLESVRTGQPVKIQNKF